MDGSKTQTYRCIFCPTAEEMEIVNIDFQDDDKPRETLFQAKVTKIYPKQIKDVNLREAKADGFASIEAFQKGIMEINRVKSINRWGFFIKFKRVIDLTNF